MAGASGNISAPHPDSVWRLIVSGEANGATNMAVDEAILEAVVAGMVPGTLRFYFWRPPCISVGYAQPLEEMVNLDLCRREGVEWVRRPTGGRAILHTDEVTYSVALRGDDPRVRGDVVTSYRHLSQGLLAGFRTLGLEVVQARLQEQARPSQSPACFDRPSHYEITCRGRKLVGSAQARRRGAILQHGSIPLRGDVARLVHYLRMPEEERTALQAKLRQRAITLEEALGRPLPEATVVEALARGFSEALGVSLEPAELTAHEWRRAQELRLARYQADT